MRVRLTWTSNTLDAKGEPVTGKYVQGQHTVECAGCGDIDQYDGTASETKRAERCKASHEFLHDSGDVVHTGYWAAGYPVKAEQLADVDRADLPKRGIHVSKVGDSSTL